MVDGIRKNTWSTSLNQFCVNSCSSDKHLKQHHWGIFKVKSFFWSILREIRQFITKEVEVDKLYAGNNWCPQVGRYFHVFSEKYDMNREDLFRWRVWTDVSPLLLWIKLLSSVIRCTHTDLWKEIHGSSRFTVIACHLLSVLLILLPSCCLLIPVFFKIFWLSFAELLHIIMSPKAVRNDHE